MANYDIFSKIGISSPYPHQESCYRAINQGKSVLLRAPCGSGKTEAAIASFLSMPSIPHFVYSLPTRSLVEDIGRRFKDVGKNGNNALNSSDVALHHGTNIEDPFFRKRYLITTIDQTVGAYCCTPLCDAPRYGNIYAGTISSAFLCFDEIHTYDPMRGLQTMMIMIKHSKEAGYPFLIMSATIPDVLSEHLRKVLGIEIIDAQEDDILPRRNREVRINLLLDKMLTVDEIKTIVATHSKDKKYLIVVNTVDRAQELYSQLLNSEIGIYPDKIRILHSRYTVEDRARATKEIIGKEGIFGIDGGACLIATQVCEVGLDISCDVLISEVAPIEAIIQRLGRCMRRGGKGDAYLFGVPSYEPYDECLVLDTVRILQKYNAEIMRWEDELKCVNQLYNDKFNRVIDPQSMANVLASLNRATFYGNKKEVEDTVRLIRTCEISVASSPPPSGIHLDKIAIDVGVVKTFYSKIKPIMWMKKWLEQDEDRLDSVYEEVHDVNQISPYEYYIISNKYASYDPKVGLMLGRSGSEMSQKTINPSFTEYKKYFEESWVKHATNCIDTLRILLSEYKGAIERLGRSFDIDFDLLTLGITMAAALHDLGKLNIGWQRSVGSPNEPLAHFVGTSKSRPIHATVSAYAIRGWLVKELKRYIKEENKAKDLGYILTLSVAHHHMTRAIRVEPYSLIPEWKSHVDKVLACLNQKLGFKIMSEGICDRLSGRRSLASIPCFEKPYLYRPYAITARLIRLADQMSLDQDI